MTVSMIQMFVTAKTADIDGLYILDTRSSIINPVRCWSRFRSAWSWGKPRRSGTMCGGGRVVFWLGRGRMARVYETAGASWVQKRVGFRFGFATEGPRSEEVGVGPTEGVVYVMLGGYSVWESSDYFLHSSPLKIPGKYIGLDRYWRCLYTLYRK